MSATLAPLPTDVRAPVATAQTRTAPAPSGRRTVLGVLVGYLVIGVLIDLPAWTSPATRLLGPAGDPQQAVWFLNWTPYALVHGMNPLLTHHINSPDGANLMWNMLMPLPGLLLWPVTATLGPAVSYNALITLGMTLAAWCAFLAFRRYTQRPAAAVVAGAMYGFSPYIIGHSLGHPNLAFGAIPPLLLIVLDEVVVRQRRRSAVMGAALGLLAAAQLLIFSEVLASAAIASAVAISVLAVHHRDRVRERLPYIGRTAAVAALVFFPIAEVPLMVQFLGAQSINGTIQRHNLFVSDLLNFVVPTDITQLAPAPGVAARFSGNIIEQTAYLGIPLLAIVAFTAWRYRGEMLVRVAAVSAAVIAVLSLGPSLHIAGNDTGVPLPWLALQQLPLLGNVLPGRLSEYVGLFAALLLAVFVDRVALRAGRRRAWPLLGAAATAVTLVPLIPLPTSDATVPRFFNSDQVQRIREDSVVLMAPYSQDWNSSAPMLWQVAAGMRFRMPEGYVLVPGTSGNAVAGPVPTPLSSAMLRIVDDGRLPAENNATRVQFETDLSRWAVETVVVGPMQHRDAMVAFMTWLLRRPPVEDQGVEVWWGVHTATAVPAVGL